MGMSGIDGRKAVDVSKGGRTKREQADASNINKIVARHRLGGVPDVNAQRVAEFGFVPAVTFMDCMLQIRKAQEAFNGLPAVTRDFFHNDPRRFVEYIAVPEQKEQLIKLGLLMPKEAVKPPFGSAENPMFMRSLDPPAE